MKTIYKTIILALIAAGLASCSEGLNKERQTVVDNGQIVQKVFTAKFADLTKTTVSQTGRVSWQVGDKIRYYSTNGGTIGEYTVTEATSSVELPASVNKDALYFIAVYGGDEITEYKGTEFTLSGVISYEQSGNFADNHISVAKTHDMTLRTLEFKHLTNFVKFSLTREDIAKVIFRANDYTVICGESVKVTFDLNTDEPSMTAVNGNASILVNTYGSGTFYIATLPVQLQNGFQLIAYDKDGNRVGSVLSTKSVNLKAGGMIDLGILDEKITMTATPVYDNPVVDMTSATANCYMVKPNSEFQFDARFQGNSTDLIGGNPVAAKVLWESFGTDVTPSEGDVVASVSYSEGYIDITTNKAGNAVVALIDWNENVLWSWHIWVTDYDPSVQCHSYPWTNSDYMMDRNLGALSATPGDVGALGLLYQWGRKDPFLGSSSINESVVAASTLSWPVSKEVPQDKEQMAFSISNPTTFLNNNMQDGSWTSSKTKYDPCPAGWRVPDGDNYGPWSNFPTQNDWEKNWKGMIFGAAYCGSDAWFPAGGGRWGGGGSLYDVGNFGDYWSCTPSGSSAYDLTFSSNGFVSPQDYYNRAFGFSVRCQSE